MKISKKQNQLRNDIIAKDKKEIYVLGSTQSGKTFIIAEALIEYANKKRVWLTSPTTLMSTLTVIQVLLKNMERDKYSSIIHEELNKLGIEFTRYKERWNKLSKSIETVNKDIENINITTDKITKRFESINSVDIKDKEYLE